jgi:tRNA(Arg) A34 adenosine deaminase TadA
MSSFSLHHPHGDDMGTTTTTTCLHGTSDDTDHNHNDHPYVSDNIFKQYQTYGWKPCHSLTDHENYMDLVLLITRSSQLKQGSMACILVRPPQVEAERQQSCHMANENHHHNDSVVIENNKRTKINHDDNLLHTLTDRIITIATNQSFYKEKESDIHAEIVAICQVSNRSSMTNAVRNGCNENIGSSLMTTPTMTNIYQQQQQTTHHSIAYITMPPCKRCFAALVTAGIKQIVSRYPSSCIIQTIAKQRHIQLIVIPENRHRIQTIIDQYYDNQQQKHQKENGVEETESHT